MKDKLIYILDDLRVSKLSTNVHFGIEEFFDICTTKQEKCEGK